jgi:hypothetical protein
MKRHTITVLAHGLTALLALGLATACQPAQEASALDDDSDEAGFDVDKDEQGWGFDNLPGRPYRRAYGSLDYLAQLDASWVVPPYNPLEWDGAVAGRSILSFRTRRDFRDNISVIRSSFRLSLCGCDDDDSFIDIAGIDICAGGAGIASHECFLSTRIDGARGRRLQVINGCVTGVFGADFCDGCDGNDLFHRIRDNPSDFYYNVRTLNRPDGIARGQLSAY